MARRERDEIVAPLTQPTPDGSDPPLFTTPPARLYDHRRWIMDVISAVMVTQTAAEKVAEEPMNREVIQSQTLRVMRASTWLSVLRRRLDAMMPTPLRMMQLMHFPGRAGIDADNEFLYGNAHDVCMKLNEILEDAESASRRVIITFCRDPCAEQHAYRRAVESVALCAMRIACVLDEENIRLGSLPRDNE